MKVFIFILIALFFYLIFWTEKTPKKTKQEKKTIYHLTNREKQIIKGLNTNYFQQSYVNKFGMTFSLIPSGTVIMNSECNFKTTITKAYYLQTTELSEKQWKFIFNKHIYKLKNDDYPITNISWYRSQEYIKKINIEDSPNVYRLPTEAEWLHAYQGGYIKNSKIIFDERFSQLVPVGSTESNAWGLFEMDKNVWEWCEDWYEDFPLGHILDYRGGQNGKYKVLCGGYISNKKDLHRQRYAISPIVRYDIHGMRLLLEVSKTNLIKSNIKTN
jgi:formylglycine-generating enzyme required for sulfatase activity